MKRFEQVQENGKAIRWQLCSNRRLLRIHLANIYMETEMKQVCPKTTTLFSRGFLLCLCPFFLQFSPAASSSEPFDRLLGDNPPVDLNLMSGYYT